MPLAMSRPWKHPKTGVYYFRRAVPEDLRAILGKREEKRSLGTKDPREAKRLHGEIALEVERRWAALRAQPEPLSQRQVVALSGLLYREQMALLSEEPGSSRLWQNVIRLHEEATEKGELERWLGPTADELLLREGVRTDPPSRTRVIEEAQKALLQAAEALKRNAEGDYREDPDASRFPEWERRNSSKANGGTSLHRLFEDWWTEAKALGTKPSTFDAYGSAIKKLITFLGHDDATLVSTMDVVKFKDHRLASTNPRTGKSISPKTVKDGDLAGLKSIFNWAVANHRLPKNPAAGVTLKVRKPPKLRERGFTDEEAQRILRHAYNVQRGAERECTHAAKRWVPWICAYTGARVGEIAQLRKQDVRLENGDWVLNLTPEAGTIKDNQAREVILHEHLVEQGFPDFVRSANAGHLFLKPSRTGDVRGPLRGLKNRLADFARQVVKDPNVAPNHGWRHRFKTIGRNIQIQERTLDAISGHAPQTVGGGYGDVTLEAKAAAMARFPRYEVP